MSEEAKAKAKRKLEKELLAYYTDYFDLDLAIRMIKPHRFDTREFGFARLDKGFTRNKSFEEPQHLHEYLSTFAVLGAYIGALYSDRLLPQTRYDEAITIHTTEWLGRELVFDLDLDEYDPVRSCKCKGKSQYCEKCWPLLQEAADVIDETLRDDFGFKHLQWLFTGGRGYHCWVLDSHTFDLDQEQRSAIVSYMQLIQDPKGLQRVDDITSVDRLKERVYRKLGRNFILNETKKMLTEDAGFTPTTITAARDRLKSSELIRDIVDSIPDKKESIFLESLVRHHYPRIDHKVTIDTKRLIRMPSSIHARAMLRCEPIDDPVNFFPDRDGTSIYSFIGEVK